MQGLLKSTKRFPMPEGTINVYRKGLSERKIGTYSSAGLKHEESIGRSVHLCLDRVIISEIVDPSPTSNESESPSTKIGFSAC